VPVKVLATGLLCPLPGLAAATELTHGEPGQNRDWTDSEAGGFVTPDHQGCGVEMRRTSLDGVARAQSGDEPSGGG